MLSLIRTRIGAGRALSAENPATGVPEVTPETIEQYEAAQEVWLRYLNQAGEEAEPDDRRPGREHLLQRRRTWRIARGDRRKHQPGGEGPECRRGSDPNLNTLTTLAIFQYFNGEFEAGDKTAERAAKESPSKSQTKTVEKQMAGYRKRAESWQKQRKKLAKQQAKTGKEQLENPLGGLSGAESSLAP